MFAYPKPQDLQSVDIKDYRNLVLVCGSRNYADKKEFHDRLIDYIDEFDDPILFISGAAPTGADDLIIRWCKKFKYPCKQYPAEWDRLGRSAGFIRNSTMCLVATHVLAFYDGQSPGTRHMLNIAEDANLAVTTVLIKSKNHEPSIAKKGVFVSGCVVRPPGWNTDPHQP